MTKSIWNAEPKDGQWNTASNWKPVGVPTGTAEFCASSQTAITFSATSDAAVTSLEFSEHAPSYTFTLGTSATPALTIKGEGVFNHSGKQQSFVVAATSAGHEDPQLKFMYSASAGEADMYYCVGPESKQGYGGGVISFCEDSKAGGASFKVWTGAARPPKKGSTVGGEVSFSDSASADRACFTIYGTLGTDGDTFGNVVFHDNASASRATFTNVGGTVSKGDGGNTQFYGTSSAAYGVFNNYGATHSKGNGGDVAFDATASGGHGHYYNHAATAAGGYGGVTSFNNNWPDVPTGGASAGHGAYVNYGAREGELGGGGHIEFSAKYGSPTAANATITNYGSTIAGKSNAGHTIFSISQPTTYYPTAGQATIYNHPGVGKGSAAGFTEFSVYPSKGSKNITLGGNVPTAGDATLINLGASKSQTPGGYTIFSGSSSAGNATLIAHGGTHGGCGGTITFYDHSEGDAASVHLLGNAELSLGDHTGGVSIGSLELTGGVISIQLGTYVTSLTVVGELTLHSAQATLAFWQKSGGGFAFNTAYTVLTSSNLSEFTVSQFSGNSIEGVEPTFSIVGNDLQVTFSKAK